MKKNLLLVFTLACFLANAQTFVSTSPENKNVILEEFTGISCVWCPAGHLIGQQMHDQNPNDWSLDSLNTLFTTIGAEILYFLNNFLLFSKLSTIINSEFCNVFIDRTVISSKFPIGVGMIFSILKLFH